MSDQGNKPTAMSPAFASLLKTANNTVVPKPNFGARDQTPKPNFRMLKQKDESTLNASGSGTPHIPPMSKPAASPFANLQSKNKEVKQNFGSSSLEKISAKYLNNSEGLTPKFGAASFANATIACPIFARRDSSPGNTCSDIRPLAVTQEIQIPVSNSRQQDASNVLSTSAGSSDFGSPSASSKLTFSPIPNKTTSLSIASTSPKNQDAKVSSLSKLKDRYVKNARVDNTGSSSPNQEDNRFKRFNFDLSSALVARKPTHTPVTSHITPLRHTQEHTIVVDQLSCMSDARALLELPPSLNAVTRKRISCMGKVICKKWKAGTCENIPLRYKPPYHIPAFKFDTMSPDDEIQAKFKRRR